MFHNYPFDVVTIQLIGHVLYWAKIQLDMWKYQIEEKNNTYNST